MTRTEGHEPIRKTKRSRKKVVTRRQRLIAVLIGLGSFTRGLTLVLLGLAAGLVWSLFDGRLMNGVEHLAVSACRDMVTRTSVPRSDPKQYVDRLIPEGLPIP